MKKLLIIIYGIFLAFVIGYSVFASMTFDGAIKGSYEKGVKYPQELIRLKKLGWRFTPSPVEFQAGKTGLLDLFVLNGNGAPLTGATVVMVISRPAGPETLPVIKAVEQEKGHYAATVNLPDYGHWLVDAQIFFDGQPVGYEFRIYANK